MRGRPSPDRAVAEAPARAPLRARVRAVLHAILGAPDYDAYVRHLRAHHPGAPVPDRRAFERERLTARYERPGSRCC